MQTSLSIEMKIKYPPQKIKFTGSCLKVRIKNAGQGKEKEQFFLLMSQNLVTLTVRHLWAASVPASLGPHSHK